MKARSIPWDETKLKEKLMIMAREQLSPDGFLPLRHEDSFSSGIPDITITGPFERKITTWWEVKHAKPNFVSKGIQDLTMLRLARAGISFYIIYDQGKGDYERTLIVEPKNFGGWKEKYLEVATGFNHQFVIDFIRGVHK